MRSCWKIASHHNGVAVVERIRYRQRVHPIMKAIVVAFSCFLLGHGPHVHGEKAYTLPPEEEKALVAKADAGDPDAACQMWEYHLLCSGDEDQAAKWLDRAAELGHAEAQRWLAYKIVEYKSPHQTFGKTPQEAVLKLLSEASKTNGTAAQELGERYYEGYFGMADKDVKARRAFELSISHHNSTSWEHLAGMLHRGEGGPADQPEAYYYICLATQCTHPESVGGRELWDLRRRIETKVSFEAVQKVWKRVDDYILKERKHSGGLIDPPPLLGLAIPEKQWNEYVKATDKFEASHREQLKKTRGEHGGAVQPTTRSESK